MAKVGPPPKVAFQLNKSPRRKPGDSARQRIPPATPSRPLSGTRSNEATVPAKLPSSLRLQRVSLIPIILNSHQSFHESPTSDHPMIRKLSLTEIIEAAVSLDKPEQAVLIAAIIGHNEASAEPSQPPPHHEPVGEWAALSSEGLARAYGDGEPDYSEADLVP